MSLTLTTKEARPDTILNLPLRQESPTMSVEPRTWEQDYTHTFRHTIKPFVQDARNALVGLINQSGAARSEDPRVRRKLALKELVVMRAMLDSVLALVVPAGDEVIVTTDSQPHLTGHVN